MQKAITQNVTIMFDGVEKECTVTKDRNQEWLCETGSVEYGTYEFVKFSKDSDLETAIEKHNEANNREVEVIPEVTYGKVTTFDEYGDEVIK